MCINSQSIKNFTLILITKNYKSYIQMIQMKITSILRYRQIKLNNFTKSIIQNYKAHLYIILKHHLNNIILKLNHVTVLYLNRKSFEL